MKRLFAYDIFDRVARVFLSLILSIVLVFGLLLVPGVGPWAGADDVSDPTALSDDPVPMAINTVVIGEYTYALDSSDNTASLLGYSGTTASLYMGTNFGRTVVYGGVTYTITSINITIINSSVKTLTANYNANLKSINVAGFRSLTGLTCNYNANLVSLNISNNTALTSVRCENSALTELDASRNTSLNNLYCQSNQLTKLMISNNNSINTLSCQSNQMIDVTGSFGSTNTWNAATQSAKVLLEYDEQTDSYISATGLIQSGHEFSYGGSEAVIYNKTTDRFEIPSNAVTGSSFSGAFSTAIVSGKNVSGIATFELSGSGIRSISASPSIFPAAGGFSQVTISGMGLPPEATAGLFDWTDSLIGLVETSGSDTEHHTTLYIPENNSFPDEQWTVKVSLDDGVTWIDRGCQITVRSSVSITSISATPNSLPSTGGMSKITITGTDLPTGVLIGFTPDPQAAPGQAAFAPAVGGGLSIEANLNFPPSFGVGDTSYYLRMSFDGGTTWFAINDAVTVIVSGQNHDDTPTGDIAFNGKQWVRIGQDGEGVASEAGTVTLLLAHGNRYEVTSHGSLTYNTVQFSPDSVNSSTYNNSYLHQEMQAIETAIGLNPRERQMITPRTLYGTTIYNDLDHHYGMTMRVAVWPLSAQEAIDLTGSSGSNAYRTFTMGNSDGTATDPAHNNAVIYQGIWWLRSSYGANFVWFVGPSGSINWYYVVTSAAVRPTLLLDLDKVLFTSAGMNNTGKNSAAMGSVVKLSDIQGNSAVKYTMIDTSGTFDSFSSTETQISSRRGATVSIPFTGAVIGSNTYVSAYLTRPGENTPFFYVKLSQNEVNGTASFTLPSSMDYGSYTIHLINEQLGNDNFTDFASQPIEIGLNIVEQNPKLTVELELDQSFTQDSNFLIRIISYDDSDAVIAENSKILTVKANETSASFDIHVAPGFYRVQIADSGGTWRYFAAAGQEIHIEGEDAQVSLLALLRSTQWVTAVTSIINIMAEGP